MPISMPRLCTMYSDLLVRVAAAQLLQVGLKGLGLQGFVNRGPAPHEMPRVLGQHPMPTQGRNLLEAHFVGLHARQHQQLGAHQRLLPHLAGPGQVQIHSQQPICTGHIIALPRERNLATRPVAPRQSVC